MCRPAKLILIALICGLLNQSTYHTAGGRARLKTATEQAKAKIPQLTRAERALAAGSRKAIVRTGMSESYFDRHFTLVKVINQSADRRAVWKFSINEYETIVSDQLGFYTENGRRVDTHSVTTTLQATSEIKRTISRRTANQIMQQCIGSFSHPSVEYRASGPGGARLVLTAESVPKSARQQKENEREEARQRQAKSKSGQDADVIEREQDEGPPIVVGSVDLQTGKCTKGQLIVAP